MHHITKPKSSQTGFMNMTMSSLSSNDLQSPDLNPIEHLFSCVGTGYSNNGYVAEKYAVTA